MAYVMNELMVGLGLDGYIAHGGDIGSFLSRICAVTYDACGGAVFILGPCGNVLTHNHSHDLFVQLCTVCRPTY